MATNDIANIHAALNDKFQKPLPDFYKRRIVFWIDEDQEFIDEIDGLEFTNVKKVTLSENNNFTVKKLLCYDDVTSNYLVYCPVKIDSKENDWLLNVKLYSEEFRADMTSIMLGEMDITPTTDNRKIIKDYSKFFKKADNRKRIKALNAEKHIVSGSDFKIAILCALCRLRDQDPKAVIKAILMAGLDKDENALYQAFVTNDCEKLFWAFACHGTGYQSDNLTLDGLAIALLLTALTKNVHKELLTGLENFIASHRQSFCYELVEGWMHDATDSESLYYIAKVVETKVSLEKRLLNLELDDVMAAQCMPCINVVILNKVMTDISNQIIDADKIESIVEKRKSSVWYENTKIFFDAILNVAKIRQFYEENAASFHTTEPEKIWKEYTTNYYRMDSYYRNFLFNYQKCVVSEYEQLRELIKHIADNVENIYTGWYLAELGRNWTASCPSVLENDGEIPDVEQQESFYARHVDYSDKRVFVIISDALRYEVAASLSDELAKENMAKVELKSMQGIFPTETKFGMAALLPHKNLSVVKGNNGVLSILADGQPTDSTNRENVLKAKNPDSLVLKADEFITKKSREVKEIVDDKKVIYIYHDKIDKISHSSESDVVDACDKTIAELKNIVHMINSSFGTAKVLITADHGFLFNNKALEESSKVSKSSFKDKIVEDGRRLLISNSKLASDYLIPVKFMKGESDYFAYSPKEYIRFAIQGGGSQFVHGGASLQEMVVPLIEYNNMSGKKSAANYEKKPVEIGLLSSIRKITNMMFNLDFYQRTPVDSIHTKANYKVYFVDSTGKKISDEHTVIADRTSDNNDDRKFRFLFNLKAGNYERTQVYYLEMIGDYENAVPERTEFQIIITCATDEFNF